MGGLPDWPSDSEERASSGGGSGSHNGGGDAMSPCREDGQ